MSKPTEFKYPLDENGEPYFAGSHVNAIEGMEDIKDDINSVGDKVNSVSDKVNSVNDKVDSVNDKVDRAERNIKIIDLAMGDMVGDTGWVDYQVPPSMKNNAVKSGYPCSIREVRVGNSLTNKYYLIKSIRFNITGIKDGQQIAQLPTGFITKIQTVDIVGSARKAPVSIKLRDTGVVEAFLKEYDTSKDSWIYGQYTWIE